jgi:isoquinoline 1-oxidoreductase subunit alpha
MAAFIVNGQRREVTVDPNTPLLWVLREHLKLTGTKFGCGIASCGACTVHIDGKATRSCAMPVSLVEGKSITTIEGLSPDGGHPLQKAWIAEQVPQCGYCQSGQIMQAASLLAKNPDPTKQEIVAHMDGNLCRCMTYGRIQRAIVRAAADMRSKSGA